jgi:glycosyltransferase involved in cell wall biosynthesis
MSNSLSVEAPWLRPEYARTWISQAQPGLISVALCTYNGSRFLDEQITSVLAQQDVQLEVVVCDDGSSDDTWQRLLAWGQRDARIRLFRNANRLGFAFNFAKTMGLCRGEFIAPCDQDDRWHPDKLTKLLDHIGNASLSYCDSNLVDEAGLPLGQRLSDLTPMYAGKGVVPLCLANSVSGHAMILRRELLVQAWPFPADGFHDWWLTAVAATRDGVRYLPDTLVDYRQHLNSQTDISHRRTSKRDSWGRFRKRARWLEAIATLPGPDQSYCKRLSHLWAAREHEWFSPMLVWQLSRRATDLLQLNQRERFFRFAIKQFFGQRWRPGR